MEIGRTTSWEMGQDKLVLRVNNLTIVFVEICANDMELSLNDDNSDRSICVIIFTEGNINTRVSALKVLFI